MCFTYQSWNEVAWFPSGFIFNLFYFLFSISGRYANPCGGVREVAVKIPRLDQRRGASAQQLQDFYQEAKIAISFQHENILECLGVCNCEY